MAANVLHLSMGDPWHSFIGSTSVLPDMYEGTCAAIVAYAMKYIYNVIRTLM